MSARSAQRTRRRRWRMGRDIAGEREMRRTHGRRVSGLEALVVEGEQRRLLLLKIRTAAAAAAGQTITRTTDEANLFIHLYMASAASRLTAHAAHTPSSRSILRRQWFLVLHLVSAWSLSLELRAHRAVRYDLFLGWFLGLVGLLVSAGPACPFGCAGGRCWVPG